MNGVLLSICKRYGRACVRSRLGERDGRQWAAVGWERYRMKMLNELTAAAAYYEGVTLTDYRTPGDCRDPYVRQRGGR